MRILALLLLMLNSSYALLTHAVSRHYRAALLVRSFSSSDDTTAFFKARQDGCWRPTVNDVERISWGKPAKKKGTGSRGVPHRLNEDERFLFDLARQNGFLQVAGSAWRSQRRDAPILNTYRSLCDARAQVAIVLHKGNTGMDELVVDLSPLRLPTTFNEVAAKCLEEQPGGDFVGQGTVMDGDDEEEEETVQQNDDDDPWETRPIYQLPPYCITWELPRSDAKALGKKLASLFETAEGRKPGSGKKPTGVKPGKNRRHGGYGIG